MDTLRAKQAMEILDVFKNVHSQVAEFDKRSVQASTQSRKPKTQRDVGAEVNVDKAIELMNKTLESKLGALEFVVQNLEQGSSVRELSKAENRQILTQSFQATNNTGDLIPLWNSIVRQYKQFGLSVDTQEIIRQKVLELEPNLEAIIYGITETIEYIFQQPFMGVRPRRPGRPARGVPGGEPPAGPPPPPPSGPAPPSEPKKRGRKKKGEEGLVPPVVTPADVPEEKAAPQGIERFFPRQRQIIVEPPSPPFPEEPFTPRFIDIEAFREAEDILEGDGRNRMVGGADGDEPEFLHQNALVILDYLRTLSFYKTLKLQVDSGKLELFSVELLTAAFKNIFDTLSSERVNLLKRVIPRGVLGKTSIRNIPADLSDYNARLDALGEELGLRFPPEDYAKLATLPRGDVSRALGQFREDALKVRDDEIEDINRITGAYEKVVEKIDKLKMDISLYENVLLEIEDQIQILADERYDLSEMKLEDEQELGPMPELPNIIDFPYLPEWEAAVEDYMERNWNGYLQNKRVREHNEFVMYSRDMAKDEKQQEIDNLQRDKDEAVQQLVKMENELSDLRAEAGEKKDEALYAAQRSSRLPQTVLQKARSAIEVLTKLKEQPISAIRPVGEGKGKAIETRGMAGLRKNYGFDTESESESESDDEKKPKGKGNAVPYDDRRNDMYVTRPYRRK